MNGDELIEAALDADRTLKAAQARWDEEERELLRRRGTAIQAALDGRAGAQNIADALEVGRARVYAMTKQGLS